ncbi:hypothetical protein ACEPAG_4255 [Sanghuangporus baumii]
MTQEEPDTCRICSAPAEPEAPLFHPCKCSGTIRYIHQDCLTTWLAHSKKKSCDVCKYQYAFTKVYSENMPKQIPFILFLRKFAQKAFWGLILGIRGIMVAAIWLAFLPYVTVWTWRFYFIMGENIAWWIFDHPRPNSTPVFHSYFNNLTLDDDRNRTDSSVGSSERSIMDFVTSYPIWRALSADIFTGQIIASLIVLVFLGIFLLREWIIQNARPGVFEDEHIHDAELRDGLEAGAEPDPEGEVPPMPDRHIGTNREEAAVQLPADTTRAPIHESLVDGLEAQANAMEGQGRSRRKRRFDPLEHDDNDEVHELDAPRVRARRNEFSLADDEEVSEHLLGTEAQRDGSSVQQVEENPSRFKFTFTVDRPASSNIASSPQRFSFDPPADSAGLFGHQPSTLPYPFPLEEPTSTETEPPKTQRPAISSVGVTVSEMPEFIEGSARSSSLDISSTDYSSSPKGTLSPPSITSYKAPEQLDIDSLSSSSESKSDAFDDDDSDGSQRESVSSSMATVADSAFREDLDEYFPEINGAMEGRQDPIRVEELLDDEQVPRNEPDLAVNEEERDPEDAAEDQDDINDDDVDNALEAIGMRGPLTSVFQNAALMIFVLDTTIGLAVWLPFTIGKTIALLLLEPIRIVYLLHWPIRVIRYATDPLVDLFIFTLYRSVWPIMTELISSFFDYSTPDGVLGSSPLAILNFTDPPKPSSEISFLHTILFGGEGRATVLMRGADHAASSPIGQILEPYFAQLGRKVRLNAAWVKASWIELANGDATVNRFFAIALGYLIASFLLAIYLNVLNVGNVQSAGRAMRNAIKQQLIVLKVAVFILTELVVFPLGCGIMFDFCTLRLFPDASVQSRFFFSTYAPVTATFYHWMIGTMFMYQFAILLGGCRKIMRPGGLWFIKDPRDQNFHPIRDILDRPTLVQVRKLAISAVMYSFVVALGMGGLVTCLRFWGPFLLPLRWKLREPLSSIPIDLLFLHIVMPATLKYFRPHKAVHAVATRYWKWASKQLRISSYMFGGMYEDEMRPSKGVWLWLTDMKTVRMHSEVEGEAVDGYYRRVPAQDNISLPREIRATVAVDRNGNPLDEAGRRLMEIQNVEAEKAKRRGDVDYTVVYLPPLFRERIFVFIISLWVVGSLALVGSLAIPTLLGRAVFGVVLRREVHDGYSVVVGFYLLWGCYHIGILLDRLDKRRQRYGSRSQGSHAVYVFKRSMLWIGNVVWVVFWFGVVIPTLLALVIEVYLVHPLRLIFNPTMALRIRIVDSWAVGLVYTKIALITMRLRPETRIDTAIKEMKENGWRRVNAVAITLNIIAPVAAGLLGMLLLPILIVIGLQQALPTKISSNTLFLYVYPGIFIVAGCARLYTTMQTIFASWTQQIRDSEFLVEMRLRNLDAPSSSPTPKEPEADDDSAVVAQLETLQTEPPQAE